MADLKQATKKNIIWSALDRGGQQVLLAIVGLVTMKILSESDFGLVGMLALFTALASNLCEGGLAAALIRKTDATEQDYNTVFWANCGLGLFLYLVLWIAAPWIADYNETPELVLIGRVLFSSVVFYSLALIQSTVLIKRSDFKRLGVANVISVAAGGGVAVALAIGGYGVWALVFQMLVYSILRTVLLWVFSGWMPRLIFDTGSLRRLFGFSSKLLLGNLANTFSSYYYVSALGRYFSPQAKGVYYNATKARESVVSVIMAMFGQSIYLMFSHLQDDASRFLQALRKSVRVMSFVLFPVMLGLAAVIRPVLKGLFGEKWLDAVPLVQIFCISGIFAILNYTYANSIKVKGRSDITLVLDIVNAGLMIFFLFGAIRYGLQIVAAADAIAKGIIFLCYVFCARRLSGYRFSQQFHDLAPYAGLAAVMFALIWPLKFVIGNNWLLLVAQLIIGAGFYLGAAKVLGSKVLQEVIDTFRKRR